MTDVEEGIVGSVASTSLADRLLDYLIRRELHENLILAARFLLLFVIADILTPHPLPLGRMMLIPIAIAAVSVSQRYVMAAVLVSAFIREQIGLTAWTTGWTSRVVATIAVFSLIMFLWCEVVRKRRAILSHAAQISEETRQRFEAEQRLVSMVQSMPTAVVAIDSHGRVRLSNEAAETLLGVGAGTLHGQQIHQFLPNLADIAGGKHLGHGQRSAALIDGHRQDGEPFRASVWFATYAAGDGAHLVAILADASDDIRDFQQSSLHTLLKSTRVLVGSMAHEIRNICAAISVTQASLSRLPGLSGNDDLAALSALTESLTRISTAELASAGKTAAQQPVDIRSLIAEFKIVMNPSLRDAGVELEIEPFESLPYADADRHSMLQVLINLTRNSIRAMKRAEYKAIRIGVNVESDRLCVRLFDTGPGVREPDQLFRAFQPGAHSSGLGLFISRALVRSCGGDLTYETGSAGCTMCIRLKLWAQGQRNSQFRTSEISA
ncbi:MAG: PAS domain-containing protein [Bryobacteraceae bacterium]|nr:PAS domain-containing protein [Bryobacteraceae bacterium]